MPNSSRGKPCSRSHVRGVRLDLRLRELARQRLDLPLVAPRARSPSGREYSRARFGLRDRAGRRCRGAGTPTPSCCGGSRSGSSATAGSTPARPSTRPTPGDFFTCSVGDVPVVVTRDRDGELHALLNVCRHRGSLVAQGRGNRATLQCPYHAWTYELDGRLRSAPRGPELELDGICLRELAVETWGPLLFVHPEPEPPPLAETLGPLPELLAAGGIELDALRFRRRSEFELACNWKIAVENYLECYHCAVAHPGFSQVVDVSPGRVQARDPRARLEPVRPQPQRRRARRRAVPLALAGDQGLRAARAAEPRRRPGRAARRRSARRASSTTSSPRTSPTPRSTSCSPSTTRSGSRTARSSSRCRRASAPGCSTKGRCLPESERLLAHFQALVREALA